MLAHDLKLCVILSHHYVDNVVTSRYNRLKYYNPKATIYPVGLPGYELLDGSAFIDRDLWPNNDKMHLNMEQHFCADWSLGDLHIYQAYLDNPDYDYYFLVEYDTAFNTPILDFFDITSKQCGGNSVDANITSWIWHQVYKSQTFNVKELTSKELGNSGVTTCLWFSNSILSLIVKECLDNKDRYNNMFSELRLGSLIKKYATLNLSKQNISEFISYSNDKLNWSHEKFFYHPCKQLLDAELEL